MLLIVCATSIGPCLCAKKKSPPLHRWWTCLRPFVLCWKMHTTTIFAFPAPLPRRVYCVYVVPVLSIQHFCSSRRHATFPILPFRVSSGLFYTPYMIRRSHTTKHTCYSCAGVGGGVFFVIDSSTRTDSLLSSDLVCSSFSFVPYTLVQHIHMCAKIKNVLRVGLRTIGEHKITAEFLQSFMFCFPCSNAAVSCMHTRVRGWRSTQILILNLSAGEFLPSRSLRCGFIFVCI